jgi:hypothetical protein
MKQRGKGKAEVQFQVPRFMTYTSELRNTANLLPPGDR